MHNIYVSYEVQVIDIKGWGEARQGWFKDETAHSGLDLAYSIRDQTLFIRDEGRIAR